MLKINATVRASVRQIVAASSQYDVSSVRIGRDGSVSALKDADKTFASYDGTRYLVGHVSNMVGQDGTILTGW